MPEKPIRLLHVITGLQVGGAELALQRLLVGLDRAEFEPAVVALTGDGPVGEGLRARGIPVTTLELAPGRPDPRLVLGLRRVLRCFDPDLVQSWMYHADLVAALAVPRRIPLVWNIHHTVADLAGLKPATRLVVRWNARLSHSAPDRIVCCAEATRTTHAALGYCTERMLVIPNGVDPDIFRPDPAARGEVREQLGLDPAAPLIGMCARFHPDKDHQTFLQAAELLHAGRPGVGFVLWGSGVVPDNPSLAGWIGTGSLRNRLHLLGQRDDSPRLAAALDLATLSSASEAFPTVLVEAMACGVPCVTTDVGDAARIVGATGLTVPCRDPQALAAAWERVLVQPAGERLALGAAARQRVVENFTLARTTALYVKLYRDIITGIRGARP
ncbi:MAG: glycosyltransferase [Anaerolineales bacterium]|nr:glycosyltransferase [Anaerolineales bacterium]